MPTRQPFANRHEDITVGCFNLYGRVTIRSCRDMIFCQIGESGTVLPLNPRRRPSSFGHAAAVVLLRLESKQRRAPDAARSGAIIAHFKKCSDEEDHFWSRYVSESLKDGRLSAHRVRPQKLNYWSDDSAVRKAFSDKHFQCCHSTMTESFQHGAPSKGENPMREESGQVSCQQSVSFVFAAPTLRRQCRWK